MEYNLDSEVYISWNGPSSTSFACHGVRTMITDRSREIRVIYQMDNKLNCLYSDMQLHMYMYMPGLHQELLYASLSITMYPTLHSP